MKKIILIITVLLFSGCGSEDTDQLKKNTVQSIVGNYEASYKLFVNNVLESESTEGGFHIFQKANAVTLGFETKRDFQHDNTGLFFYLNSDEYLIKVTGKPYEVSFDDIFKSKIALFGEKEEGELFTSISFEDVETRITGWMKKIRFAGWNFADYDCDLEITFTVDVNDYRIVITQALWRG